MALETFEQGRLGRTMLSEEDEQAARLTVVTKMRERHFADPEIFDTLVMLGLEADDGEG